MPILAAIKSGANGELFINLTIKPDMVDKVMLLVNKLAVELKRSVATKKWWQKQAQNERVKYESDRVIFRQQKRLAISVYHRTGSITLACKAGDWLRTDMRMFIRDAKVTANKKRKESRNARIFEMKDKGMSCRDIAAEIGISAGQVSKISRVGAA